MKAKTLRRMGWVAMALIVASAVLLSGCPRKMGGGGSGHSSGKSSMKRSY